MRRNKCQYLFCLFLSFFFPFILTVQICGFPFVSLPQKKNQMSLRSLLSCLALLHVHPLFSSRALVASDAAGKLNLYNDFNCNHPSTLNPIVTLPLSTCLVTTGGEGLVVAALPACPQGTAAPIFYSDTACGVQTTVAKDTLFSQGCFQIADGVDLFVARSVMFSCQPAANNPLPSSTSTAVVSALAAVATGTSGSSGGSGGGGTTSAAGSTPTDTSSPTNGTGSSGSGSSSSSSGGGSGSGTDSSSSSSSLTTGDIIALAVGLGIDSNRQLSLSNVGHWSLRRHWILIFMKQRIDGMIEHDQMRAWK